MDSEEIKAWKGATAVVLEQMNAVASDMKMIEGAMIEHLTQFFDWSEIEFTKNFDKIILKFESGVSPVIRSNIGDLGMDFIISADYDDMANRIVTIEVYPNGVSDDVEWS